MKLGKRGHRNFDFEGIKTKFFAGKMRGNHTFFFADAEFSVKNLLAVFALDTAFFVLCLLFHDFTSFLRILQYFFHYDKYF